MRYGGIHVRSDHTGTLRHATDGNFFPVEQKAHGAFLRARIGGHDRKGGLMSSVRLLHGGSGFDPGSKLVHRKLDTDPARRAGQCLTFINIERFGGELRHRTRIFHAEFACAGIRHAAVHDNGADAHAASNALLAEHDRGSGKKVRSKGPGAVAASPGVKEGEIGLAAPLESAGGFKAGRGSRAAAFDHLKGRSVRVQFKYLQIMLNVICESDARRKRGRITASCLRLQ